MRLIQKFRWTSPTRTKSVQDDLLFAKPVRVAFADDRVQKLFESF